MSNKDFKDLESLLHSHYNVHECSEQWLEKTRCIALAHLNCNPTPLKAKPDKKLGSKAWSWITAGTAAAAICGGLLITNSELSSHSFQVAEISLNSKNSDDKNINRDKNQGKLANSNYTQLVSYSNGKEYQDLCTEAGGISSNSQTAQYHRIENCN